MFCDKTLKNACSEQFLYVHRYCFNTDLAFDGSYHHLVEGRVLRADLEPRGDGCSMQCVKSGSTLVGGLVKSRQKQTRREVRGLGRG